MARQAAHCLSAICLPSTASAVCLTGTAGFYRLPPNANQVLGAHRSADRCAAQGTLRKPRCASGSAPERAFGVLLSFRRRRYQFRRHQGPDSPVLEFDVEVVAYATDAVRRHRRVRR
jgi:hypothetical protein